MHCHDVTNSGDLAAGPGGERDILHGPDQGEPLRQAGDIPVARHQPPRGQGHQQGRTADRVSDPHTIRIGVMRIQVRVKLCLRDRRSGSKSRELKK